MIKIISIVAVIILLIPEAISQSGRYETELIQVQDLLDMGDIKRAKNMVSELMESYPDRWFELSKKMISINNESGLYHENMAIFSEGHKRGYFYFIYPGMAQFKPYLNLPGFDSLSSIDLAMREEANKRSETTFSIQLPEQYNKEKRYPVIYIFHGGGRSAEKAQDHWQVAVLNKNFIKVYLQSYRHFDSETYGWGSGDPRLDRDIDRIFREIAGQYSVDTGFVITGGISAGATAAIDISLRGIIPVKGYIAWCPDQPSFVRNNNLSELVAHSVRGYISAGENDHFRPGQELLVRRLDSLGIQTRYDIEKGSGHNYPASENSSVNKALKFIIDMEKPAGFDPESKINDAISNSLCRGISIATGGEEITLFYNYGSAFRDSLLLPDQNTIYETGSLSKLITVFIYGKLLDEKILDANDIIGKYLPGLENRSVRNIRLDQLVTHTSGLASMPDNLKREVNGNPVADYSEEELLTFLNRCNLQDSSSAFIYSNTGTALLGLIMERATGENYIDLLHKYVTGRYNLNHTHIRVPDSQLIFFADGSSQGVDIEHWDIFNLFAPTGGIRSSAEDLSVFLNEYLFNNENIKSRQRMEKIRIEDIGEGIMVASGWFVKEVNNERIFFSSGSTGGFSAFMGFNSNSSRYTAILSNSSIGLNETGWKLLTTPVSDINGNNKKFLLETKWGGTERFNKYNPGQQSPGCHSTALAQICYYHRLQPYGVKSYITSRGDTILEDYSSHNFNWDLFRKNIYDTTSAECADEMALYIYYFASMLEKNFGTGSYQKTFHKRQIKNHLDCKVRERFGYKTLLMSRNTVKRIIRKQIDKGCPVYFHYTDFGGNGHSIVIDGYQVKDDGFWVHANYGWGGKSDGWYRYEKDCFLENARLELIITIEPVAPSN